MIFAGNPSTPNSVTLKPQLTIVGTAMISSKPVNTLPPKKVQASFRTSDFSQLFDSKTHSLFVTKATITAIIHEITPDMSITTKVFTSVCSPVFSIIHEKKLTVSGSVILICEKILSQTLYTAQLIIVVVTPKTQYIIIWRYFLKSSHSTEGFSSTEISPNFKSPRNVHQKLSKCMNSSMHRIFYHKTGVCQLNGVESSKKSVLHRLYIRTGRLLVNIIFIGESRPARHL